MRKLVITVLAMIAMVIFTANCFGATQIVTKSRISEPPLLEKMLEQTQQISNTFTVSSEVEGDTLSAHTGYVTFRAPYACTVIGYRASVITAPTADLVIDINEGGTSLMGSYINAVGSTVSNKLVIQSGSETSLDTYLATSPTGSEYYMTDTAIADDAEITIDIDSTTGGVGLKITFYTVPTYLPTNY